MGEQFSYFVLWLTFVAVGLYTLYVVIRKAVRDGIRDAAQLERDRASSATNDSQASPPQA